MHGGGSDRGEQRQIAPRARFSRGVLLALLGGIFCGPAPAPAPQYEVKGACKDGQPDGPYELRLASGGPLQATGPFEAGARSGLFTFYDSDGRKIAEVPYRLDQIDGMVKLWYPAATPGTAEQGPRKLESLFAAGVRDGLTTAWYADGARRAELVYMNGVPRRAQYWSPAGENVIGPEGAKRAEEGEKVDLDLLIALDKLPREHPIRCDAS
jgi:antitoxin component YwqK of YwqJK toxin-antitoxin module